MKRSLVLSLALAAAVATGGVIFYGCSSDNGTTTPTVADVTTAHGSFYYYVLNDILVPMGRSDYAIDLNGDGHADNQLGNIVGALSAQNFDVQTQVTASVTTGSVILLISMQTNDSALMNDAPMNSGDPGVGVTFYLGKSMKGMVPDGGVPDGGHIPGAADFSGMGMFTVDTSASAMGANFFGRLNNGEFKSNNPVTTKNPVTVTVKLDLVGGGNPISLAVHGAHVQFQTGTDMASGAPGLLSAELHGSIKNEDVQGVIIPNVAMLLTTKIQILKTDPNNGTAKMIESLFDTGGCTNPDGSMAVAKDLKIDPCEVSSNNIIQNVLAPDVQIYDASGNYAPNKANTNRDSLSLGLGFTAVKATFTAP
jgi:hypothetical protein